MAMEEGIFLSNPTLTVEILIATLNLVEWTCTI